MASAYMAGNIHSEEGIGTTQKRDALGVSGNIGNAASVLMGGSIAKHKAIELTADPVAYEKNVLVVAQEATDLLLSELAKSR